MSHVALHCTVLYYNVLYYTVRVSLFVFESNFLGASRTFCVAMKELSLQVNN